jgi:DNA polymerase epsilon subunit 2
MFLQNEIPEDEWVVGLEFWAREYLKGEGGCGRTPTPALGSPNGDR